MGIRASIWKLEADTYIEKKRLHQGFRQADVAAQVFLGLH